MTIKKIIRFILIIIWLGVIFWFSNQNGEVSKSQSEEVITTVVDVVSNKTEPEKQEIVKDYTYITRKIAHFLEYLVLAILIIRFLVLFKIKYLFLITLLTTFLIALGDEYHQSFVDSRDANIKDSLIDTSGALLGLSIYTIIVKYKK